jgi:hypothetical protein
LELLRAGGQLWKFWVGSAVLLGAIGPMIWLLYSRKGDVGPGIILPLLLTGGISLAFLCLSIRCPSCAARWFWLAVSTQEHTEFEGWLLGLRACPRCAWPGDQSNLQPDANTPSNMALNADVE